MNKISYKNACDLTYYELQRNGMRPADMTRIEFENHVHEFCRRNNLIIN